MSQQGIWPDGSSGVKNLPICMRCGGVFGVFGYGPGSSGCTCSARGWNTASRTVPALPASLCEELAGALEPFAAEEAFVEATLPDGEGQVLRADMELERRHLVAAHAALERYREAVAEGARAS